MLIFAPKISDLLPITWIDDLPVPDPQVLLDDGVVPQQPTVPEHSDLTRRSRHPLCPLAESQLLHAQTQYGSGGT